MATGSVAREGDAEQGAGGSSRRIEIARCATRLFAEKGYDATSILDICEAAGIGRGLLYHYFRTKEEILRVIHEKTLRPLIDQFRSIYAEHDDPRDVLRGFSAALLCKMAENRDEAIVWGHERKALRADTPYWKEALLLGAEVNDMLQSTFERGIALGIFRPMDVQLAMLTWKNLHNHTYTWMDPGGRLSAQEISDFFVDVFLRGITAPRDTD
jgi:AcrR family transcriptional regulator